MKMPVLSWTGAPRKKAISALNSSDIKKHVKSLKGWRLSRNKITKIFRFNHYDETLAFVNEVARIARRLNHHPEIIFGYKECKVRYWTHAVDGLTKNDFICAAKIDNILLIKGHRK